MASSHGRLLRRPRLCWTRAHRGARPVRAPGRCWRSRRSNQGRCPAGREPHGDGGHGWRWWMLGRLWMMELWRTRVSEVMILGSAEDMMGHFGSWLVKSGFQIGHGWSWLIIENGACHASKNPNISVRFNFAALFLDATYKLHDSCNSDIVLGPRPKLCRSHPKETCTADELVIRNREFQPSAFYPAPPAETWKRWPLSLPPVAIKAPAAMARPKLSMDSTRLKAPIEIPSSLHATWRRTCAQRKPLAVSAWVLPPAAAASQIFRISPRFEAAAASLTAQLSIEGWRNGWWMAKSITADSLNDTSDKHALPWFVVANNGFGS